MSHPRKDRSPDFWQFVKPEEREIVNGPHNEDRHRVMSRIYRRIRRATDPDFRRREAEYRREYNRK